MDRQQFSLGGVIFCLFCILLFSAPPLYAKTNHADDRLVIALNNEPPHFNPAIHSGTLTGLIGTQLFAGLVRCDAEGRPHPYLAKKWNVALDGKRIDFVLRENAVFHDETPIRASDVLFSLNTVRRYHPFSSMLTAIDYVEITGEKTFSIFLNYPYPALFKVLTAALTPILPEHVYGKNKTYLLDARHWHVVGSGPFTLESYERGHRIVLKKFSRFFLTDRPKLSELKFLIFSDPAEINMALESGEVQLTGFSPVLSGNGAVAWPSHLVATDEGFGEIGAMIGLNLNLRQKPFDDIRVRQAFSLAIDRQFIAENIFGPTALMMDGPLVPQNRYYSPPTAPHKQDIAKANSLLDEAGYPRDRHGQRMSVAITSIPNARSLTQPLLEYLRYYLSRDLGVDLLIWETPDLITWENKISQGNFQASIDIAFTWSDPIIGIHRLYESRNIRKSLTWSNISGYRNTKVDSLLKQVAESGNEKKKRALYKEVQQIIRHDTPVIWFGTMPYATVYDRELWGLNQSFWGMLSPMDNLYWQKGEGAHLIGAGR